MIQTNSNEYITDTDTYIVLDLEWNQNPDGRENAIEGFPFEIIEIGAVKLDHTLNLIDEFSCIIKPVVYKKLHSKVYEITNKSIQELRSKGKPFQEAFTKFIDWCSTDKHGAKTVSEYTLCTWGDMDLTELQKNIKYHNMDFKFKFPLLFYDIQKLYYRLYCKGTTDRPPLERAVYELQIKSTLPFHRALDDARYTVKVMQAMDFNCVKEYISIDYFNVPTCKEDEVYMIFPDYSKYVSRTFISKEEAMTDKTVTDIVCSKCRRMLPKRIKWFSSNQRHYYCLASCPEHGYVKGKIRIKPSLDGQYFVIKTIKPIDKAGVEDIRRRKEELRKKRAKHHAAQLTSQNK